MFHSIIAYHFHGISVVGISAMVVGVLIISAAVYYYTYLKSDEDSADSDEPKKRFRFHFHLPRFFRQPLSEGAQSFAEVVKATNYEEAASLRAKTAKHGVTVARKEIERLKILTASPNLRQKAAKQEKELAEISMETARTKAREELYHLRSSVFSEADANAKQPWNQKYWLAWVAAAIIAVIIAVS